MIKLLALVVLALLFVPNPIPSVHVGATIYNSWVGKSLACNGHRFNERDDWVAVPIEWIKSGVVSCGDRVYACLNNGH